jgi:hypothetical protein
MDVGYNDRRPTWRVAEIACSFTREPPGDFGRRDSRLSCPGLYRRHASGIES